MGSLFAGIFGALKGLLSSKKFWVSVATVAGQAVIKDEGLRESVRNSGIALVLAQGAVDFGKAKAK